MDTTPAGKKAGMVKAKEESEEDEEDDDDEDDDDEEEEGMTVKLIGYFEFYFMPIRCMAISVHVLKALLEFSECFIQ